MNVFIDNTSTPIVYSQTGVIEIAKDSAVHLAWNADDLAGNIGWLYLGNKKDGSKLLISAVSGNSPIIYIKANTTVYFEVGSRHCTLVVVPVVN